MSFETIQIYRYRPIVNGFVQVPNNLEKDKSANPLDTYLAANPTHGILSIGATGGARSSGIKGTQEMIELPAEVYACCGFYGASRGR